MLRHPIIFNVTLPSSSPFPIKINRKYQSRSHFTLLAVKPLKTPRSPARWSATLASLCRLPRWGGGTEVSWHPAGDTLIRLLHWHHFSHPAECNVAPGCCFGLQRVAVLDVFPGLAVGSTSRGGCYLLQVAATFLQPALSPVEERMAPWRRGWPAGLGLGRAAPAHSLLVVPSSQRCWARSPAMRELVQSKLPDPCEVSAAPSSLPLPLSQPPVLTRAFVCGGVLSWAKLNRFTQSLTFFFFFIKQQKMSRQQWVCEVTWTGERKRLSMQIHWVVVVGSLHWKSGRGGLLKCQLQ